MRSRLARSPRSRAIAVAAVRHRYGDHRYQRETAKRAQRPAKPTGFLGASCDAVTVPSPTLPSPTTRRFAALRDGIRTGLARGGEVCLLIGRKVRPARRGLVKGLLHRLASLLRQLIAVSETQNRRLVPSAFRRQGLSRA